MTFDNTTQAILKSVEAAKKLIAEKDKKLNRANEEIKALLQEKESLKAQIKSLEEEKKLLYSNLADIMYKLNSFFDNCPEARPNFAAEQKDFSSHSAAEQLDYGLDENISSFSDELSPSAALESLNSILKEQNAQNDYSFLETDTSKTPSNSDVSKSPASSGDLNPEDIIREMVPDTASDYESMSFADFVAASASILPDNPTPPVNKKNVPLDDEASRKKSLLDILRNN